MELKLGKQVRDIILDCSAELDASIARLAKTEDKRLALAYKKLAGEVMGLLFTNILRPLYFAHPELLPQELKEASQPTRPSLTPFAVSFTTQLLASLQKNVELVASMLASQEGSLADTGDLKEIRESLAHLETFLRSQSPTASPRVTEKGVTPGG